MDAWLNGIAAALHLGADRQGGIRRCLVLFDGRVELRLGQTDQQLALAGGEAGLGEIRIELVGVDGDDITIDRGDGSDRSAFRIGHDGSDRKGIGRSRLGESRRERSRGKKNRSKSNNNALHGDLSH